MEESSAKIKIIGMKTYPSLKILAVKQLNTSKYFEYVIILQRQSQTR